MITIRPSSERGSANFGWLDTRHSFSFSNYYDPRYMGFGPLRVINEDKISPSQGFGTHGHRDMEIVTYVLKGALEHKDSLGNGSIIRPGDVQRMSAGTGIMHSEFNASETDPVHLLQIWLLPATSGIEPGYEQIYIAPADKQGHLRLIGSQDGRDGSVTIHQDVSLYSAVLGDGDQVSHTLAEGRVAWLQVAQGSLELNGQTLTAGDGAAIQDLQDLTLASTAPETELLLFDMVA
ncbi:pirin family protein [Leptolyngbya sp. BL0902]|uniref:pirin family protein n=1 Tax=Leptolyngbya sp. BL0902 TaxID=1115757 RepID=UPI0018E8972B|nr:pirin family protein [Leptolyngbya sp. BL0902]QQE64399.1 pirin family protein [Leptolyngbya sp. BL0902]